MRAYNDRLKTETQRAWEIGRYISLNVMSTQVKQGAMSKIINQMKFPWERDTTEFQGNADEVLAKWDNIPFGQGEQV